MYDITTNSTYKIKPSNSKKHVGFSGFLIILLIVSMVTIIGFTSRGSNQQQYMIIKIEKGDTLWEIVEKYNTNNEDPRKLVSMIKKINKLENVILQPGQTIKFPG